MTRRELLKLLGLVVPAVAFAGLLKSEVIETIVQAEGFPLSYADTVAEALEKVYNSRAIEKIFYGDSVFLRMLAQGPVEVVESREMRIPLKLRPSGNYGQFAPECGSLGRGAPTFEVLKVRHRRIRKGAKRLP